MGCISTLPDFFCKKTVFGGNNYEDFYYIGGLRVGRLLNGMDLRPGFVNLKSRGWSHFIDPTSPDSV